MITTEKEYRAALKKFERLMDEIVRWEEEHYPVEPPSEEARAEFRKDQETEA